MDMDIIVYDGTCLREADLRSMARSTVSCGDAGDANLNIHTCKTPEELSKVIHELAALELQSKERFFPFKTKAGSKLLRLSQVLYFKSSGHRIIVKLTDGTELYGRTLRVSTASLLEPLAQNGRFYRIYRATFVNMAHVTNLGPAWVELDDGTRLDVSRKYYNQFLSQYKSD